MSVNQAEKRIRIRQGLNLPIEGRPAQGIHDGPELSHVALCGPDYTGLKPRLLVAAGDEVQQGQPLFIDKRDPAVPFCAPGTGRIAAINRGARRVLQSVVVSLRDPSAVVQRFEPLDDAGLGRLDTGDAARRLQEAGLWTAFRTRPFNRVPMSDSLPSAIFVTAIETRPLAADPQVILAAEEEAFADGLSILTKLSRGDLFLCTAEDWAIELPEIPGVRRVEFAGPHPAGLPGTHMHFLYPVSQQRVAWYVGYQDVIAIGKLFRSGVIDNTRVFALGGTCVRRPRLLVSRLGASTADLTRGELSETESSRVIAGSVLGGRATEPGLAFVGRYQQQVTVIMEGGKRHLFGWTGIYPRHYSAARTFLRMSGHRRRRFLSTDQNGRYTGMIPTRAFEKVMPLDILPSPLFRALLVKDTDQAQALGCLELAAEDLALCSFVCPAKIDYGEALRINLEQIERDG
jgi:Na+-transporting NADH:ubiquinone oxidoreductase subunit A